MKVVDKDALVAVIERLRKYQRLEDRHDQGVLDGLHTIDKTINTLEARDPYEQRIQYDSIKSGIQAHADTYSFNIESALFNQLTKEQQKLWRKEIEQAVISGGEVGVELARDARYKENLEVKEDKLFTETRIEKELAECYLRVFDKKFTLPKINGKQLHDFKNFINTCEQTFSMKYFDYHATQGKLFEKLALLWAVWGKEHLSTEVKDVDLQEEIDKEWEKCNPIDEGMGVESAFIHVEAFDMIARHFFELGLKAQKGE